MHGILSARTGDILIHQYSVVDKYVTTSKRKAFWKRFPNNFLCDAFFRALREFVPEHQVFRSDPQQWHAHFCLIVLNWICWLRTLQSFSLCNYHCPKGLVFEAVQSTHNTCFMKSKTIRATPSFQNLIKHCCWLIKLSSYCTYSQVGWQIF